ncbi:MAG: creatininase family protein [Rhodobacterales bacterium]|nr:creatininase family protein [Rhodobacterales bacterium]
MKGAWLANLTWPEAEAKFADGTVLLIPVGATSKAHGRHLPLGTDAMLARVLADRVAFRMPILVAPVVGLGHYPAFADFAGSQQTSRETFVAFMTELLSGYLDQGCRRISIFNVGVSTEAPLREAADRIEARYGLRPHKAHMRNLGRAVDRFLDKPEGGHADERETSMVLAIDPGMVRLEEARPSPPGLPADGLDPLTGTLGDPTKATPEKGRRLLDAIMVDIIEGIEAEFF